MITIFVVVVVVVVVPFLFIFSVVEKDAGTSSGTTETQQVALAVTQIYH